MRKLDIAFAIALILVVVLFGLGATRCTAHAERGILFSQSSRADAGVDAVRESGNEHLTRESKT